MAPLGEDKLYGDNFLGDQSNCDNKMSLVMFGCQLHAARKLGIAKEASHDNKTTA